jgi:hypothetical protein
MKARAITLSGLCALVAALALPASGAAGTPPTVQPINYTVTFTTSACGIDNLVETDHFAGVVKTDASGAAGLGAGLGYSFTLINPANGKGVRYLQTGSGHYTMTTNPDGTHTIQFITAGNYKYSLLTGGPLLSGEGSQAGVILLDSSFNFISIQILHTGGSGPANNNDPCPLIVAALA